MILAVADAVARVVAWPSVAFGLGALTAVLGTLIVGRVIIVLRGVRRDGPWHTAAAGFVEQCIYFPAFASGQPALAGGWVALKAAMRWGTWSDRPGVFNTFAVGTGLSLLFGAGGGFLPSALIAGDGWRALSLAIGPVLASFVTARIWLGPRWFARAFDPEFDARARTVTDERNVREC